MSLSFTWTTVGWLLVALGVFLTFGAVSTVRGEIEKQNVLLGTLLAVIDEFVHPADSPTELPNDRDPH